MDSNRDEIVRALRTLFAAGDVFEIRALKAVTGEYRRPHAESGYFDYDHIPQAADAVCALRSYGGAYVTLNPVAPELLARACNRLAPADQSSSTADTDTLRRNWLPIDCDPVRRSGIASTDGEHEAAHALAKTIREGLSRLGWPEPIVLDSGNGAQMLYRIELPASDGGLVQQAIAEIAKGSTDAVNVDLTVFNPARIWRLPGTVNRKGDSIPERPHRTAHIVSAPGKLKVVSAEQLRALSMNTPSSVTVESVGERTAERFDADAWIAKYCPELGAPRPWQGGRKWVFKVCPFNSAHDNGSAVITQQPDGEMGFKCHHNGCAGNDWHKLRELREPGCYDRPEPLPINWNALGAKAKPDQPPEPVVHTIPQEHPQGNLVEVLYREPPELERPWRKVTDADVESALEGTYLGKLCGYFDNVADPPLPIAAGLSKALVVCGAALSRPLTASPLAMAKEQEKGNISGLMGHGPLLALNRINTGGGQGCNFYSMLVAPSSSGKDIGGLLDQLAMEYNWYIGDAGTAEGLADTLISTPNGILSIPELQPWLDRKCWQHNAIPFLTSSFNKGFFKHNFSQRGTKGGQRAADYCYPNILASVQPDILTRIADKTDLANGFLGRFLFAKMGNTQCLPNNFDMRKTLDAMHVIIDAFCRKYGVVEVEKGYSQPLWDMFGKGAPDEIDFCWKRLSNEYYPRMAFILSLTDDPATLTENTVLRPEDWERARILVEWYFSCAEKLLLNIEDASLDSRVRTREQLLERVCRKLQRLGGKEWVTISRLSQSGLRNSNAKERREALDELCNRGIAEKNPEAGEAAFRIVNCPPEWFEDITQE